MTRSPRGGSIGPSLLGAPLGGHVGAALRQRVELLDSIHDFERAIAVPSDDPDWRDHAAHWLGQLRRTFAAHVAVTEGDDGLYAELLLTAPRLARPVRVLVREHAMLTRAMENLAQWLADPDLDVGQVRGRARDLLRELSQHRQRGADLVYEAYATDIGGET
ncbi:MAG: hemerythrin domain-containing protein [Micromonosporaceae bacterium]